MAQYTFSLPQTFTLSDEDITMIADNLMDEDTWYTWYLKDTDIFDFILHEVINIGECLDEDEVGCVLYQIDIHEQIGKRLSCVTFDDDGFTVTLANPGYGDGFHSEDEDDDDDYDDF